MAPNYDLYGSDYSFTTGKGLSSSFFNVPGTHITNYGDKGAISALIPYEFLSNISTSNFGDDVVDVLKDPRGLETAIKDKLGDDPNDVSDNPYYYDAGSASGSAPITPQELQYIDAPYAEAYGMDASTAYQEALANTAYQRKVRDLKAAGLNPVLGYSGAGSASFYGTPAVSSFGGVSYGSLGSGKSTASASETATKLQYWLPTLVNGVTNMAFTLGTKNGMTGYAAGTIAQNMVSGALGAIRNHAR